MLTAFAAECNQKLQTCFPEAWPAQTQPKTTRRFNIASQMLGQPRHSRRQSSRMLGQPTHSRRQPEASKWVLGELASTESLECSSSKQTLYKHVKSKVFLKTLVLHLCIAAVHVESFHYEFCTVSLDLEPWNQSDYKRDTLEATIDTIDTH